MADVVHSDVSPKKFLIENMDAFKEAGFDTIFMEHLYYDQQADLDSFFKTGQMPDRLKKHIKDLDRGHSFSGGYKKHILWKEYNFTTLLEAAKNAGIRIVASDISYIYELQGDKLEADKRKKNNDRIREMNYTAYKIIKENPCSKWIGFMGGAHVHKYKGIPGVADLLGVRTVYVRDNNDDLAHETQVTCNALFEWAEESHVANPDVMIHSPYRSSLKSLLSDTPSNDKKIENPPPPDAKKAQHRRSDAEGPKFKAKAQIEAIVAAELKKYKGSRPITNLNELSRNFQSKEEFIKSLEAEKVKILADHNKGSWFARHSITKSRLVRAIDAIIEKVKKAPSAPKAMQKTGSKPSVDKEVSSTRPKSK